MTLTSANLINLKTSPESRGIISLSLHRNSLKVFYKQSGMRKNIPENLMSEPTPKSLINWILSGVEG